MILCEKCIYWVKVPGMHGMQGRLGGEAGVPPEGARSRDETERNDCVLGPHPPDGRVRGRESEVKFSTTGQPEIPPGRPVRKRQDIPLPHRRGTLLQLDTRFKECPRWGFPPEHQRRRKSHIYINWFHAFFPWSAHVLHTVHLSTGHVEILWKVYGIVGGQFLNRLRCIGSSTDCPFFMLSVGNLIPTGAVLQK